MALLLIAISNPHTWRSITYFQSKSLRKTVPRRLGDIGGCLNNKHTRASYNYTNTTMNSYEIAKWYNRVTRSLESTHELESLTQTVSVYECDPVYEACGACFGCLARGAPELDYYFPTVMHEIDLEISSPRLSGVPAMKHLKLRGQKKQHYAVSFDHSGKYQPFVDDMVVQTATSRVPVSEEETLEGIFTATLQARNTSAFEHLDYLFGYVNAHPNAIGQGTKSLIGKYCTLGALDDSVVDLVESFTIFYFMIFRAKSATDRYLALVVMAKLLNEKLNLGGVLLITLTSAIQHFCGGDAEMDVQTSVLPDFATMREFLDKYEVIKQSPLFAKVYKFSMYGLALALFKPLGVDMDLLKFDKVAQEAIRKQYHLGPDFVHCALDTMLFLCERGYQCLQTGTVMPMFHSEAKYQDWYDEAEKLIRQSHFLSNPEVHGIDRFSYLADLKDVIERGRSMRKCSLKKDERLIVARLLSTLELTHDMEVTKRAAQKDRKTPLCLLLFGGSGIGKSTLENVLFQHYGKMRGLKTTSEFRYVRNPTEEYWSGMNSTQWCVVLDDIGFMSPKLQTMDPSLAEMLCIANNVPFVPAQAELSDKGRTPVRAELVLGSTNTEHLNLAAYFSCPLAVQRRFPWVIDVRVKPEYMSATQPGMLDSSLVPAPEVGAYPDLWYFTVKRVEPCGEERIGQMGRTVVHAEYANMQDFLLWYNRVIIEHNSIQDTIMKGNDIMQETLLCDRCKMPTKWCACNNLHTQTSVVNYLPPSYVSVEPLSFTQHVATKTLRDRLVIQVYMVVYWFFAYSWFATFLQLILGEMWFATLVCRSPHRYELTRAVVGYAGYRVQHSIGRTTTTKRLAQCAVAIGALIVAYKSGKKLMEFTSLFSNPLGPQGNVASDKRVNVSKFEDVGHDPEPKSSMRIRPTYEDPYPFSTDDLSQATLCSQDGALLEKHIEVATCVFQSTRDGSTYTNIALNVRGAVYMTNNHGIPAECPFTLDVICANQGNMGTSMRRVLVTESMVHRVPEHDLAFVRLRNRAPGTDLTKYMCKAAFVGKLDCKYIGRSVLGDLWRRHVPVATVESRTWQSHGLTVTRDVWLGKTQDPTAVGDCGAALFSHTPVGPVLLGIHTLGKGNQCAAMKVTQGVARAGCDALEPEFVNRGKINVSAPSAKRSLGPLSAQSALRSANAGVVNVLGSFQAEFRMRGRTNVQPTYLAPFLNKYDYEITRTRPDMSRRPWINALNDTTRPVVDMNNDVLDSAKNLFIEETRGCDLSGVHVYPLHVAINGCPGLDYCDKLNRKSSAGAPYKKSKKHFLYFIDEMCSTDVDVVDEVKDTVFEMIDTYKRGERCHPVFCGHLKDEPVTYEKARDGKTRVFTASGIAYSLVVRKYLLSVIVLMQNNRFLYETGPGTVAQSLEWEQVREHVTQFGEERIVAGDYSKFDKRMPANVILAAFDIIVDICQRAGYTDDDLRVVRGIAVDTAFPTVDFGGDLVEFYGSNPSGHPLTVIINGLVNSLYMRYCYLVLRPIGVETPFRENVALMTYGDDNIMGVSENAPWFNHTAIQTTLALVDIGYTMADKEAVSRPYITIDEANFLKRVWRWDPDVGAYVAPLDRSSIEKMLMVCVGKKNVSSRSHAIGVISTALREYFFYGREEFEQRRDLMQQVVEEADLSLYVEDSTFPTWHELFEAFWANSAGVELKRQM